MVDIMKCHKLPRSSMQHRTQWLKSGVLSALCPPVVDCTGAAFAGAPAEAAWAGGGGEPDIPQWLRYGEPDVHDALSSNGKLRPDQVRCCVEEIQTIG